MKINLLIFTAILILFPVCDLTAQYTKNVSPMIPANPSTSPMFGKDVILLDDPEHDYYIIDVCSAFNGWLFAFVGYNNENGFLSLAILKSTDHGIDWEVVYESESEFTYDSFMNTVNIVACGSTLTELMVFVTCSWNGEFQDAYLWRFKGDPFTYEGDMIPYFHPSHGMINGLSLATDVAFPSTNANPFSLGLLFTDRGHSEDEDSLIFWASDNGGVSLTQRQCIAYYSMVDHVSVAFGRSASYPEGRYFAVWDVHPEGSQTGHIYTAHTEPYFNSPFTTPVCLDSLFSELTNKVRHPVVACQASNYDNEQSNLTEIIMFEKYNDSLHRSEIEGLFNTEAVTTTHFQPFSLSGPDRNAVFPEVTFNMYDSTFMATWFDSTNMALPLVTKNINMNNPSSWEQVSGKYNDANDLVKPLPRVEIHQTVHDGLNVWIAKGADGLGNPMFDAPYSTYNGLSQLNAQDNIYLLGEYPNPCSRKASIWFYLNKPEDVTITLYTLLGKQVDQIVQKTYPAGKQSVTFSVSAYPSGTYLYHYQAGDFMTSGKLVVVH